MLTKAQAIAEFVAGCNDKTGTVYKATYKSFPRGQAEMYAYAMRMGLANDIDPRVFIQAHQEYMAEMLFFA